MEQSGQGEGGGRASELRASPGDGYPVAHKREQDRIVRVALGDTSLYRDATFVGGLGSA